MSARHLRRPSCIALLRGVSIAMVAVAALFMSLATLAAGRTDFAAQDPAQQPAKYPVTADLLMVMKYYEGIPTTSTQKGKPPKLYATDRSGQNPSLYADLAKYYDDRPVRGNCTIGWGHLVAYKPCASRKGGWDFETATKNLTKDISDKLKALNCERPTLSPGEIRAVTSFIYQAGPSYLTEPTATKNNKGKVTYKYCQGELAQKLNAHGVNTVNVITNFISSAMVGRKKHRRKYIAVYPTRAKEEIWDATGGKACCDRPAAYSIQTAIWPQGAVGTITITPTGARDDLSGDTSPPKPKICATTEAKKATPAKACGKYYLDEQVTIDATPHCTCSTFLYWQAVDDGTNAHGVHYRDLCAGQSKICTVRVQDQLVRAIAVYETVCVPASGAPGGSSTDNVRHCPQMPTTPSRRWRRDRLSVWGITG
jgi:GH24 family phage-related lysozyme (muramidase)